MRFRIELAARTRIFDRERERELSLRTYSTILAALVCAEGEVSRGELIDIVWPGAPSAAGRNRLRVALVALRGQIPGALLESAQGIRLDPQLVEADVWEIREAIAQAENTITARAEYEALASALAPLGDGTGFVSHRRAGRPFVDRAVAACLRLHQLALDLGEEKAAHHAIHVAVTLDEDSPAAWAAYLVAQWRIHAADEAVLRLRRQASIEVQGHPTVLEALKEVRAAFRGEETSFSREESSLLLEIFGQLEATRPDLWRAVLSSPESLALAGKHPRAMHDLLERATPLDIADRDEVWERSAGRLIGLKAWLNDTEGVLRTAEAILESAKDPQILRAVWNGLAIAYSLQRRWPEATEALKKTAEYARELGNKVYELTTQGNGAYFLMQQGRFEDAEIAYGQSLDRLREIDTDQARFEVAIGTGNRALVPIYRQDWSEAVARIEHGIELREGGGLHVQMGLLQSALALALAKTGDWERVPNLLRAAFLDAFAADAPPPQQVTFEFAAGALSATSQREFAIAVLNWVDRWRERIGTPRSQAEFDLCQSFGGPSANDSLRIPDDEPVTAVGRETMKRLRSEANRSPRETALSP